MDSAPLSVRDDAPLGVIGDAQDDAIDGTQDSMMDGAMDVATISSLTLLASPVSPSSSSTSSY